MAFIKLQPASALYSRQPDGPAKVGVASRLFTFSVVTLALYGDLVKRILSPNAALLLLYGLAALILVVMLVFSHAKRAKRATMVSVLAGALIYVYLGNLATSFTTEREIAPFIGAAYVCLPLAYLATLHRANPNFDIQQFALYVTVLMIPVHFVGIIQQFVSESFMISTAYSEEGGIIGRNFLDKGTFNRLPSIYASADRFSGVVMMQIVLTPCLLLGSKIPKRRVIAWVVFNLILGGVSLLVAGARSRIIILGIAIAATGVVIIIQRLKENRSSRLVRLRVGVFVSLIVLGFASLTLPEWIREPLLDLPVLSMLDQTFEGDDITERLQEAIELSQIPDNVTVLGEGLGVIEGGRPGEFGIRAMWIEGGLLWTLIMLTIHAAILVCLVHTATRLALMGNVFLMPLAIGQILVWIMAVLAGLSTSFELSQALLLFPTIAALSMAVSAQEGKRIPT